MFFQVSTIVNNYFRCFLDATIRNNFFPTISDYLIVGTNVEDPAPRFTPHTHRGVKSTLVSDPLAAVQLKEVGGGALGTAVKLHGLEQPET